MVDHCSTIGYTRPSDLLFFGFRRGRACDRGERRRRRVIGSGKRQGLRCDRRAVGGVHGAEGGAREAIGRSRVNSDLVNVALFRNLCSGMESMPRRSPRGALRSATDRRLISSTTSAAPSSAFASQMGASVHNPNRISELHAQPLLMVLLPIRACLDGTRRLISRGRWSKRLSVAANAHAEETPATVATGEGEAA